MWPRLATDVGQTGDAEQWIKLDHLPRFQHTAVVDVLADFRVWSLQGVGSCGSIFKEGLQPELDGMPAIFLAYGLRPVNSFGKPGLGTDLNRSRTVHAFCQHSAME